MLDVLPREVVNFCRDDPAGERFTELTDALVRTAVSSAGQPISEVRTNLRTNLPDGGVDTEVLVAMPEDSIGWLREKTVWQYKSTSSKPIFKNELAKAFVKKRITEGFAYRLAVCASMSAEKKEQWEGELNTLVQRIHSGAPPARVISADDVAAWMELYPSLVLRFLERGVEEKAQTISAWGRNITHETRDFIAIPSRAGLVQSIQEHADVSQSCSSVVLPVHGYAGVGKTRLVFEALSASPECGNLVLYTNDDRNAVEMARRIANRDRGHLILVADECSVQSRLEIEDVLRGHTDRARVVTIDNTGIRPTAVSAEHVLESLTKKDISAILEVNFPHVPEEYRDLYAGMSEGFIRGAVELCNVHAEIEKAGELGPGLANLSNYIDTHLSARQATALNVCSLVTKVGYSDDVSTQIEGLCEIVGVPIDVVAEATVSGQNPCGFIHRAGRFLYVTPEIVAKTAFGMAWELWVSRNPTRFINRLPDVLVRPFLERVARSADREVHRIVGDCFREWIGELRVLDLTADAVADRIAAVVDTDPGKYLPALRDMLDSADMSDLSAVRGDGRSGGWGPRRTLVWLAERLMSFPEYLTDAEALLFRLALAESEPNIANNATGIWTQVFRMYHSGT